MARRTQERAAAESVAAVDLGPLEGSVGYLVRRAQVAIFQRFFEQFAAAGVRPAQYSVLTVIEHNPGLSQTRLADALGIKKTNLVVLIDGLEKRGLARRLPTERDRRFYALFLTPKGNALMARLHRLDDALNRRLVHAAGKNGRRQLCEALRRIAALQPVGKTQGRVARPGGLRYGPPRRTRSSAG